VIISDMTALLCGSSQTHLGTSMPSGGGHIINAPSRPHSCSTRRMLTLDERARELL
jgi:hypothetical protein